MPKTDNVIDFDAELEAAEDAQPFKLGGETYYPKSVDSIPASVLYREASSGRTNIDALCDLLEDESAERLRAADLPHRKIIYAYNKLFEVHSTLPTLPSDD